MVKFRVTRNDRAARAVEVGATVYRGKDFYGLASDDTRATGIEHIAVSLSESGEPYFTIPLSDVSREGG